ncbi:MAG: T9SS type A sorting domain-containing protein [Ignavibacteriales bacterium]|nr:T9SS type A sorting domain-containing protein [Ignavibacteriales bacterium]
MNFKNCKTFLFTGVLVLMSLFYKENIYSYPGGIASRTLKLTTAGCGSCHGSSSSSSVIITITGPDTVVAGQSYQYTINVSGGSGTTGGINIATNRGSLDSVSTFLKKLNGELVHKQRVAVPSTYQFLYTAPAISGSDTIYATAKGAGFSSWNWMPNKSVVVLTPTGVNESNNISTGFHLNQNFPNPFNPVTQIEYFLPHEEKVVLKIYNLVGQEVETIVNETQQPGEYTVEWRGDNLSSGIYLYKITAGSYTQTKKMLLTK